jgi:cellulose synthase/poly-beta-1,6-N-acetylglucosamine synthase-like glycosyltransferase
MGWKQWPRWLKYGIFAEIISIIVAIILFPFKLEIGIFTSTVSFPYSVLLAVPGSFILIVLGLNSDNLILAALLSLLIYFLIGALIGLIIGKIKSKEQQPIQTK